MSQENPYSAPQAELDTRPFARAEWRSTLLEGLRLGVLLGATSGAINGWFGPEYYKGLIDWQDPIWPKAIAQGIFEGAIYGLLNSGIFGAIAFYQKRPATSVQQVCRVQRTIAGLTAVAWVLGGLLGLSLLPALGPWIAWAFPFPEALYAILGFCWAAGSTNIAVPASFMITLIVALVFALRKPAPAVATAVES